MKQWIVPLESGRYTARLYYLHDRNFIRWFWWYVGTMEDR
jgi:hypothetical protein